MKPTRHLETLAIHAGRVGDPSFGSLSTPIHQTSTYVFDNVAQGASRFAGESEGFIYSRLGNPTVRELEQRVAALEGAEDGIAFASGMGAVAAVIFGHLQQGDHLITSKALYGCTFALFTEDLARFGIEVSFLPEVNADTVAAALRSNTRMIYLETPINPTLEVIELAPIMALTKQHQVLSVVDNTFMTPVLQRPIELGADLVLHSATKYLNGHGDVIAGIVCGSAEAVTNLRGGPLKTMGAALGPMDAWLIIRGLKTLPVRVERHQSNTEHVAQWLRQHSQVGNIYWPGFKEHPGHSLIGKQMAGPGALIAFELNGGYDAAVAMMNAVKLCRLAVSLGDAETLIQHPASMTHATYSPEELAEAGISPGLIRLSVGLEHHDDIVADLAQALAQAQQETLAARPSAA